MNRQLNKETYISPKIEIWTCAPTLNLLANVSVEAGLEDWLDGGSDDWSTGDGGAYIEPGTSKN